MILLGLLLYVFSQVTMLQFSCTGAIAEDGKCVDCEARFLEGWLWVNYNISRISHLALVHLHINRCFQGVERSSSSPYE